MPLTAHQPDQAFPNPKNDLAVAVVAVATCSGDFPIALATVFRICSRNAGSLRLSTG
jgi:hypothetical protein